MTNHKSPTNHPQITSTTIPSLIPSFLIARSITRNAISMNVMSNDIFMNILASSFTKQRILRQISWQRMKQKRLLDQGSSRHIREQRVASLPILANPDQSWPILATAEWVWRRAKRHTAYRVHTCIHYLIKESSSSSHHHHHDSLSSSSDRHHRHIIPTDRQRPSSPPPGALRLVGRVESCRDPKGGPLNGGVWPEYDPACFARHEQRIANVS